MLRFFERGAIDAVAYRILLMGTLASAAAGLWCLRRQSGIPLAILGISLNALVIGANGAMPIAPELLPAGPTVEVIDGRSHVVGTKAAQLPNAETELAWLGDVLPLRFGHRVFVLSVGDAFIAIGLAWFVMGLSIRTVAELRFRRCNATVRSG